MSAPSTISASLLKKQRIFREKILPTPNSGLSEITATFKITKLLLGIVQFSFSWDLTGDSHLYKYANLTNNASRFAYVAITVYPYEDQLTKQKTLTIQLSTWWSLLGVDTFALNLATKKEIEQYKGLAYKTFCFILYYIHDNYPEYKVINNMSLTAIPDMGSARLNTDPKKLIEYYIKIGFSPVSEITDNNYQTVEMKGLVSDIINRCKAVKNDNIDFSGIKAIIS